MDRAQRALTAILELAERHRADYSDDQRIILIAMIAKDALQEAPAEPVTGE